MMRILLYTPRGRNVIASIIFSSVSIVCGQILLFQELSNYNLSHCRKINTQKIFFLNQLDTVETEGIANKKLGVSNFAMPDYCTKYIRNEDLTTIIEYANGSNIYEAEAIVRLLGDSYSKTEASSSIVQLRLLLILMVSNSLSLVLLCVNLYEDNKDLHGS